MKAATAIAVLTSQNLSADGPYSDFADGLHDELLTQLSSGRLRPFALHDPHLTF